MIISHVVAMSNNNVIGIDNDLPWNLKKDLEHFKKYTLNKVIVMGRRTYDSIGRPLPNRQNYIVSNTLKHIPNAQVFTNIKLAIKAAEEHNLKYDLENEIVIIGGGFLFRDTLDYFNKLILTRVDCEIENGEVFYPEFDLKNWKKTQSESYLKDADNDFDFKVEEYVKL